MTAQIAAKKERFLIVPNSVTLEECNSRGSQGTIGAAGLSKRLINRKADCCTFYLNELPS